MAVIIKQVVPVINYKVRALCVKPYEGHPKGCPNFNNPKRTDCPRHVGKFEKLFDLTQPIYALIAEFDLDSHVKRMKYLHPNWSDKQARCCLYWQGTARKELNDAIKIFKVNNPNYFVSITPEAMGIDITGTLQSIGINLEWPPQNIVRKVAIAAIKI